VRDNLQEIVDGMRDELSIGSGWRYRIVAGAHVLTLDIVVDGVTWLVRTEIDGRSILHGDVATVDPAEFKANLYVFLRLLLRDVWNQRKTQVLH